MQRGELEATYARYDTAEQLYEQLAATLGHLDEEMQERGLGVDDEREDDEVPVATAEPVMPPELGAGVDRPGPQREL